MSTSYSSKSISSLVPLSSASIGDKKLSSSTEQQGTDGSFPTIEETKNPQTYLTEFMADTSNCHLDNRPDSSEPEGGMHDGSLSGLSPSSELKGNLQSSAHEFVSSSKLAEPISLLRNDEIYSSSILSHTPPTAAASSYEASHFGKRMRSGGISGRLRSASDLEDRGVIDRNERNLLKDLIISNPKDVELQNALDKYETNGDTSGLECLIFEGKLLQRHHSNTFDLLDDLDLDFLNVNVDSTGPAGAKILSAEDGIGELLFNDHGFEENNEIGRASLDVADEPMESTSVDHTGDLPENSAQEKSSVEEIQRQRADSIMMFSSLIGGTNSTALARATYGQWVDGGDQEEKFTGENHDEGKESTDKRGRRSSTLSNQKGQERRLERELKKTMKEQEKEEKRKQRERDKKSRAKEAERMREEKRALKESKRERGIEDKRHQRISKVGYDEDRNSRDISIKIELADNNNGIIGFATFQESHAVYSTLSTPIHQEDEDDMHTGREEVPSGLGVPRSASDPNISHRIDQDGLLSVDAPDGWVGAYSPESRKVRINRFLAKRNHRVWAKTVKYDVRKNFADSRLRVKGRFVKKEDEELMRDLMSLT